MDTPAAALALVAGVLLIAASLPFAILALPQKPTEYLVFWEREEAGRVPLQAMGDAQTQTVTLSAAGHLANVTVSIGAQACTDTYAPGNPYGQQPVRVTWRLMRSGNSTPFLEDKDGFTCADVVAGRQASEAEAKSPPDLGSIKAANRTEADRIFGVRTDEALRNVTYTLEVTWARPAANPVGGLPIGQLPTAPATSFSLTMNLAVSEWTARIEEKPEAGK